MIPHETLVGFVCGGQAKAELTEGQTLTCTGTRTLTQAELDGGRVVGAATVRAVAGTAPKDPVVSAAVRAAIVVPARPALRLTKSASATSVGKAGDVVTYTFVATNTGNVTLTDVTVSDELAHLSELTCDQPAPASLAPGSALTCSAKLVVSQSVMDFGAIVNIAEVSGEAPGGDPADPSDDIVALDDARVGVNQRPRIGLSSTASPSGKVRLGHRIRYVLTVKNTGNVTLSELALTSGLKKLGRLGCSSSLSVGLAPGQVRICTASYRVSTGDAKRGKVVNSTVVTASAPYATSTSGHVTARATTSREVRPAATALKGPAAEPAPAALADTGGPAAGVGWLAVALVGAGAIVLARARRRAIQAGAR